MTTKAEVPLLSNREVKSLLRVVLVRGSRRIIRHGDASNNYRCSMSGAIYDA